MKRSTLELLCCPDCHADLTLQDQHSNGIVEGSLFCQHCQREFPIKDGIAHFTDIDQLEGPNLRFTRFYNVFSHIYNFFIKVVFLGFGGDRKARKVILDRLDLKGGRILEVSVGTGSNLPYLYEYPGVGEIYGLDISSGQLARCRRFIDKRGWPVDLFLATAETLPFKEESFDSILHIGGINFFTGRQQAINEMIRVARPGCKIVIADETERLKKIVDRDSDTSSSKRGDRKHGTSIIHLVPDTMEQIRMDGIWKAHGKYHGYCLEFRKPA